MARSLAIRQQCRLRSRYGRRCIIADGGAIDSGVRPLPVGGGRTWHNGEQTTCQSRQAAGKSVIRQGFDFLPAARTAAQRSAGAPSECSGAPVGHQPGATLEESTIVPGPDPSVTAAAESDPCPIILLPCISTSIPRGRQRKVRAKGRLTFATPHGGPLTSAWTRPHCVSDSAVMRDSRRVAGLDTAHDARLGSAGTFMWSARRGRS